MNTAAVPQAAANAVVEDVRSSFACLPERDVRVVKRRPYRPCGF